MAIDAATLRSTTIRSAKRGYDHDELTAFLDRCVAALEAHEQGRGERAGLTPTEVEEVTFRLARKGADPDQIDELLEHVQSALEGFGSGRAAPAPSRGEAPPREAQAGPVAAGPAPAAARPAGTASPRPGTTTEADAVGTVRVVLPDGPDDVVDGIAAYTVAAGGRLVLHRHEGGTTSYKPRAWVDVRFETPSA